MMNNTLSLEQTGKTGELNAELLMRQNRLDKMAEFMELNSMNPKLKQYEIAEELKLSSFSIQQFRIEIKMLSPY